MKNPKNSCLFEIFVLVVATIALYIICFFIYDFWQSLRTDVLRGISELLVVTAMCWVPFALLMILMSIWPPEGSLVDDPKWYDAFWVSFLMLSLIVLIPIGILSIPIIAIYTEIIAPRLNRKGPDIRTMMHAIKNKIRAWLSSRYRR